ncbi:MAG: kinase [Eubacteriales bacterium]|jgi:D-glycero-alpha-D-manno-heptose-7-phosphate kinase
MLITKTPFRMSFLGGGTDYRPFFEKYGGSVISSTFDKYCYVTIRHQPPFFDCKNHIVYTRMERTNTVDEIEHPLVRNAMKFLDMHDLRVVYDADLPARSGLGSSSSFAVGLLNGFYALKGKYIDKNRLAAEAIYLERVLCAESGGWQDQIAVAYGGFNRIDFHENSFSVKPLIISKEKKQLLNDHLMLFFTGFSRVSAEIAESQMKTTQDKAVELREMLDLVDEGEKVLTNKIDICEFGRLLDHTWKLKRGLTNKITTDSIDDIYNKAMKAGALGGKLMGAGGGGFMMIFAEPERQAAIKKQLNNLLYVPFSLENEGAQILYYMPETYEVPENGNKKNRHKTSLVRMDKY